MQHHPLITERRFNSTPGMLSVRQKWGRDWLVGLDGDNQFVNSPNNLLCIGMLRHLKKEGVWVFQFFYNGPKLRKKGTMEGALLAIQKKWNTLDDKPSLHQ